MQTGPGSKEGDFFRRFLLEVSCERVPATMAGPSHSTLPTYDDRSSSALPTERKSPTKVSTN